MTVTSSADSFAINIASTKKRFQVKKVNYPSLKGKFPRALAYGVLIGQLHRFARICTLTHDFISNAIGMGRLLLTKGYSKRKLAQYFYQFVSSRYPQANMTKQKCDTDSRMASPTPHRGIYRATYIGMHRATQ